MTYRTAEGEVLDIRTEEARGFLAKNYPAIMADRPVGMSDEYQFMPSYRIAENLIERFGLQLVAVSQQHSRNRDPRGQEHFMRFRMPNQVALNRVGDSVPELVVMNSHNGRSTLKAYAGIFRLVCSNGMIVSERSFGGIAMRHFGAENSFGRFSTVLDSIGERMSTLDNRMAFMNELMLNGAQQTRLARAMMKARGVPNWVEPSMVLKARRDIEDVKSNGTRSLWLTYNVIQESLAEARDVAFERAGARARSLRPLSGARAQVIVNEALWQAMELFLAAEFPDFAGGVIDLKPDDLQAPVAALVGPEDQAPVETAQESCVLRPFSELIALGYADMATVSDDELKSLSADEKKKLSKRKSYLKSKEA
jgi:ribosomal protein L39E